MARAKGKLEGEKVGRMNDWMGSFHPSNRIGKLKIRN